MITEDDSRYQMRKGMARVALKTRVTGERKIDARGKPFLYSNEMAERHSAGTLDRWSRGYKASSAARPTQRYCQRHRQWERPGECRA